MEESIAESLKNYEDRFLLKLAVIILGYLKGVGYDIEVDGESLRRVAKEMLEDKK